jgi:choline-sulfatase
VSGRPNVLLVMVDQLAARWLPAYGHDAVHAPALTALAECGVTFEAAYCPSPLCAPSRSAMLSGRLASRIGVYDNAAELPASVPTFAHHLRAAGYRTILAGKMHFVGPDQLHGFERRLTTDIYPAGVDWTPDWTRDLGDPLPWYHTMESVLTPARCVASMQTDYDDEVAFHSVRQLRDLARADDRPPFLLVASFTSPHDPWEIPSRYWDLYDPDEITLPQVPLLPLEQADPHSRRLRAMYGDDAAALTDEQIRCARHAYYAAISYVDERIGELLETLRQTGLEETTTVVFTADHGEMLGERGLWYKMAFFDPSAQVPLIVRPAGTAQARRVSAPVSTLDLAPTLLELAGCQLTEDPGLDGVSLAGELSGGAGARAPVICEYHAEGVTAPAAMVRDGALKLTVCATDPDQLYDVAEDPNELRNLAPAQPEVVARLRRELERRLDLASIGQRVLESQRDRRLVSRALLLGEPAPWDFQPTVDASMQYVRNRADMYDLQRRARLEVRRESG